MYELMTLQTLPPKNAFNDFDSDIQDGLRPEFFEEVMNDGAGVVLICVKVMLL